MNADVAVTDTIASALNRHMAHMAESVIQSAAGSSSASPASVSAVQKSSVIEECGQLMSLWRPIVCRSGREFQTPSEPPQLLPIPPLPVNNNNKTHHHAVKHFDHYVRPNSAGSSLANSKSIPVHCVVMNTTTPCYLSDAVLNPASPAASPDKAPVTSVPGSAPGDEVDVDSYAIIPASTLFTQIVPVVLRKLGYSDDVIFNANGWLMLKNWRPLSLTQIASSERETVGGVLGELTTVATLRIYIRKSFSSNRSEVGSNEVKNKVLRWLMSQSQHLISNSRFPLDEKWQQKVMRGERPSTPSSEVKRQFDAWFVQEMSRASSRPDGQATPPSLVHLSARSAVGTEKLAVGQRVSPVAQDPLAGDPTLLHHQRADGLPPRVRMRTTFDPEQELPRLQRWFAENQHPTRFQLQLYVQELNELESRRGRKPLDVSNLVYWFKNARAAYKRAEIRNHHLSSDSVGADWPMTSSAPDESSDVETRENERMDSSVHHDHDAQMNQDDDDSGSESRKSSYDDVKNEPLDLNKNSRDADEQAPSDLSPNRDQPDSNLHQQDSMTTNAVNEDNETDDEASESESDEDYAENLSISKHEDLKKSDLTVQSEYAAAAAAVAGYPAFPLGFNSQINPHGLVYMTSPYLQGIGSSLLHPSGSGGHHLHHRVDALLPGGSGSQNPDDRRKRNRTFIDPVTEVPRLEHWFSLNTHPSHSLVLRYTEELNRQPYRLKFPKLEPKNVQFWFKNRRAKCKRLKLSL